MDLLDYVVCVVLSGISGAAAGWVTVRRLLRPFTPLRGRAMRDWPLRGHGHRDRARPAPPPRRKRRWWEG